MNPRNKMLILAYYTLMDSKRINVCLKCHSPTHILTSDTWKLSLGTLKQEKCEPFTGGSTFFSTINQGIMNDKRSQFSMMNEIVNNKKGHNIVNDSFAHRPGGLLFSRAVALLSNWKYFGGLKSHEISPGTMCRPHADEVQRT